MPFIDLENIFSSVRDTMVMIKNKENGSYESMEEAAEEFLSPEHSRPGKVVVCVSDMN